MCLSKIIIISIFVVFISSGVSKSINCNDGSLFLSNHTASFKSAHQACKKSGGTLAHISNENFAPATDLVFQCLGPNKNAWIGSWNSKSESDICLTLYVGNTSPGGSITKKCSGKRYALCNTNKHLDTNDTEEKTETSESLPENEEKSSDLPLESSLDSNSRMDDDKEEEVGDIEFVSESPYLNEEIANLPNVWHPGDNAGMVRVNDLDPNNISFLWGIGGDFMFGSPDDNDKNNDDTSSQTMSVDDEEEEYDVDDENEEVVIEDEEMEKNSTHTNKDQQNASWNSVVDTDLIKDESDDDYVVQNA
ncbi:hypothetical protein K501DRAFT_280366 [Backusella circina FSU 941]|nr:hypothetical protein K501DRAFT_280366 [Backusella circina FSU 941]